MKAIATLFAALLVSSCAATDTNLYGRFVVMDSYTAPTCATATAAGELCVAGDIETNANLDIAGTSTLTGATTVTGALTASSTLAVTGASTLTGATGVTGLLTATGGITTTIPLIRYESQHFCGQGANGTTATYIGPVLKSAAADETTYVFGAAGCDGLDNTTEATADAPLDTRGALKVLGMSCIIDDGGTDDVYTFQMRDDTADVAGVTCNVTLDGAGDDTCSVLLAAPVTVASASAVAVKQVAATDDDCSGCDTECFVYFTR